MSTPGSGGDTLAPSWPLFPPSTFGQRVCGCEAGRLLPWPQDPVLSGWGLPWRRAQRTPLGCRGTAEITCKAGRSGEDLVVRHSARTLLTRFPASHTYTCTHAHMHTYIHTYTYTHTRVHSSLTPYLPGSAHSVCGSPGHRGPKLLHLAAWKSGTWCDTVGTVAARRAEEAC